MKNTIDKYRFSQFSQDIYKPQQYIQYNDAFNKQLLQLVIDHRKSRFIKLLATKEYIHLFNYIQECTRHLPNNMFNIHVKVFYVLNKWQDFPKCNMPNCNARIIFTNENSTYRLRISKNGELVYNWPKHCCPSHAQLDPITRQHFIDTCKERYDGAINVFQVPTVKEKSKQTILERFNVDHPMHSEEIKNKLGDTLESIHGKGIRNAFQIPDIIQKIHAPEIEAKRLSSLSAYNMENYGVPWYVMTDEFAEKVNSKGGISKEEKELVAFIKTLTNDEIIQNSFKIIPRRQLDIYIPSRKLAFEFNGTYYHSIEHMRLFGEINLECHLQKTKLCEELGIKLIHIWEDEWVYNHEKTLQFIANIINNKIMFDTTTDTLVLDRSKFNKCWKVDGYELVEETEPDVILRAKATKDKYKVPDCGKLILRKVV